MIRFSREGTKLWVGISTADLASISKEEAEKQSILWFAHDLGGNALAAAALEDSIRAAFSKRIEAVRREAYEQGAKDRANRANHFSGLLHLGMYRGGCAE